MLVNVNTGQIEFVGAEIPLTKRKIICLLIEHKELTISEIQRKLAQGGDSFNYRSVWEHVERMRNGWLEVEKRNEQSGKPVYVRLVPVLSQNKKLLNALKKLFDMRGVS